MKNGKITLLTIGLFSIAFPAFAQIDFLGMEEEAETSIETPENVEAELKKTEEPQTKTPAEPTAEISEDYFSGYIEDLETEKKAKNSARELLDQKPQIITLRQNQQKLIEEGNEQRRLLKEKIQEREKSLQTTDAPETSSAQTTDAATPSSISQQKEKQIARLTAKLEAAPLGLYWDATVAEIKELGFELQPAERKDYKNVYVVLNPHQQNNTFKIITAVFGLEDHLWCIFAQGKLLDDDPKASKVLQLYNQYYKALEQKYGNAKQFFTPYSYEEKLIEGEGKEQKITYHSRTNPLGGDNFLQELQEGKAVLYATFENGKIGVTLGVSVDGDGKSYISIDYKNLTIMKREQDANFNRLIEDI